MVRNFFILAIRNLGRQKLYSVINILGLTVGLTAAILILLWVHDELNYDKFLGNSKRLYQVWLNAEFDGKINTWNSVPLPTYEAMKDADSNIKESCVMGWGGRKLLTAGEKKLTIRGYYASKEFFEMFDYPFIYGDPETVLDEPRSIVITDKLAKMLFNEENPIGQTVTLDDQDPLKVTGILEDIPGNSSLDFQFIVPWAYRESKQQWVRDNKTNWGNYSFQVFLLLHDENKERETVAAIENMLQNRSGDLDDIEKYFFLHPLLKWRLYTHFEDGKIAGGMIEYVRLFTVIAVFILFIACINFMNLATARSEKRVREVGIRKSLGSNRYLLISQFLSESVFIAIIAYLLAIVSSLLLLPSYNNLVDKQLVLDFTLPEFWIFSLIIILITGVVSGSYPAFYLSSFNPVRTLKGTFSVGKKASLPRQILVVLQFGFAIVLIAGTFVIVQQINMVQNRELGYDQDNLISVWNTEDLSDNYDILKTELLQSGVVEAVTRSNSRITDVNSNNFVDWPGKPEQLRVLFVTIATDYDYAQTMGIKMLQGRDFSKEFASDSNAIIINKAALDLMELEDPLNTKLGLWGDKRQLIGVIDNTIMGSPYEEIRPLFMIVDPEWIGSITFRLKQTDNLQASLSTVQTIFEKHNPAYPFEYTFADQEFQRKFTQITLTKRLATIFAGLALFITGLGLFGLASFTAQQRTKEIGIRKVLGASVLNLMGLLTTQFAKLVTISFVLATPIAWYLLDKYLDRYTLRIDISFWIFPIVGLLALIFAVIVVSDQARRAATSNPVESLRNE